MGNRIRLGWISSQLQSYKVVPLIMGAGLMPDSYGLIMGTEIRFKCFFDLIISHFFFPSPTSHIVMSRSPPHLSFLGNFIPMSSQNVSPSFFGDLVSVQFGDFKTLISSMIKVFDKFAVGLLKLYIFLKNTPPAWCTKT